MGRIDVYYYYLIIIMSYAILKSVKYSDNAFK